MKPLLLSASALLLVVVSVAAQEATSVKTNIPVDGKCFIIPKNMTFTEMPTF